MAKFIKILAGVVGVLLLLLVIGIAAVVLLINPNDYKTEISTKIKEKTGRELAINGEIQFSLFPWLGLKIENLILEDDPRFSSQPFVKVGQAGLKIEVLPLFKKQIQIGTIFLDGFELNLIRNAQGKGNWETLSATAQVNSKGNDSNQSQNETSSGQSFALAVRGIDISNASLSMQDKLKNSDFKLDNINLVISEFSPGQIFNLDFGLGIASSQPAMQGQLQLSAKGMLDDKQQLFKLGNLQSSFKAQGQALPGQSIDANLSGNIFIWSEPQKIELLNFQAAAYGLQTDFSAQLVDFNSPRFSAQFDIPTCNLKQILDNLGIAVSTADPKVLTSFAAQGKLQGDEKSIKLVDLVSTLDQTKIQIQSGIKLQPSLSSSFEVAIDDLDADRYLAPEQDQAKNNKQTTAPKEGKTEVELGIPVQTLRELNTQGQLKVGKLKVNKVRVQNVLVKLQADKGLVKLSPVQADLYQGKLTNKVSLDVRQNIPKFSVAPKLQSLRVGELLQDISGKQSLTGIADYTASFTTAGQTIADLKQNLNGKLNFDVKNGTLRGANIPAMLRNVVRQFKGKTTQEDDVRQTDFSGLSGSAVVKNGIINNNDLRLESPVLQASGKGKIDLPKDSLDYVLKVKVQSSLKGDSEDPLAELVDLPIPMRVQGSLAEPQYKLDVRELLADLAKNKAAEAIEQKIIPKIFGKQEGKEQVKPSDLLKKLFP